MRAVAFSSILVLSLRRRDDKFYMDMNCFRGSINNLILRSYLGVRWRGWDVGGGGGGGGHIRYNQNPV